MECFQSINESGALIPETMDGWQRKNWTPVEAAVGPTCFYQMKQHACGAVQRWLKLCLEHRVAGRERVVARVGLEPDDDMVLDSCRWQREQGW